MVGRNEKLSLAGAALLALVSYGTAAQGASLGNTDETIKLAINEWTGQHVTTHIAGGLLERMGYDVEFVTAGYVPQFTAMSQGTLHASLEIWNNLSSEIYDKAVAEGGVVDIGELGLDTVEGWAYPKHMEEICPGLPDWKALKDCSQALATADTFPDGRILAYPAEWGTRSAEKVKGLQLPYQAVPAGSEGALVAELKAARDGNKPLIMEFWGPHWVLAEVDVGWVDFPEHAPECETDPAWGGNASEVHDCGFLNPVVTKVLWSGFEEEWPAAYRFLSDFSVDAKDQAAMMNAIDQQNQELEQVVADWIDNNEVKWKPWIESATN